MMTLKKEWSWSHYKPYKLLSPPHTFTTSGPLITPKQLYKSEGVYPLGVCLNVISSEEAFCDFLS